MPGHYRQHLDDFGFCQCGNPSNETEIMVLEYKDDRTRRWKTDRFQACADCFGLK